MIEDTLDLFSLLYRFIITRILQYRNISLEDIPSIPVKQCYKSKAFIDMGYVHIDNT